LVLTPLRTGVAAGGIDVSNGRYTVRPVLYSWS
jgi:hypothetical protein